MARWLALAGGVLGVACALLAVSPSPAEPTATNVAGRVETASPTPPVRVRPARPHRAPPSTAPEEESTATPPEDAPDEPAPPYPLTGGAHTGQPPAYEDEATLPLPGEQHTGFEPESD